MVKFMDENYEELESSDDIIFSNKNCKKVVCPTCRGKGNISQCILEMN